MVFSKQYSRETSDSNKVSIILDVYRSTSRHTWGQFFCRCDHRFQQTRDRPLDRQETTQASSYPACVSTPSLYSERVRRNTLCQTQEWRPRKPRKEFAAIFPHTTGRWAKKDPRQVSILRAPGRTHLKVSERDILDMAADERATLLCWTRTPTQRAIRGPTIKSFVWCFVY